MDGRTWHAVGVWFRLTLGKTKQPTNCTDDTNPPSFDYGTTKGEMTKTDSC